MSAEPRVQSRSRRSAVPDGPAAPRRRTWSSTTGRPPSTGDVIRTTVLIAGALAVIAPVVWAALSSFKSQSELAQTPPTLVPHQPTLDNYTTGLRAFDFTHYLTNSRSGCR